MITLWKSGPRRGLPAPFRSGSALARIGLGLVLLLSVGSAVFNATAHEGEQHGEPPPKVGAIGGPVTLSEEGRSNLGLETVVVASRTILSGPTAFGAVEALPGRHQAVASRVAGRVTRVFKFAGDPVSRGDAVLEIESRAVADPPVLVTLTAPIGGVVTRNGVEPGSPVEADATLMEIADLSKVRFRMDVFEVDFGRVARGRTAFVSLEAYPDRGFEGVITRIGDVADPETRTIPVWADLDNADRALKLNLRGRARIAAGSEEPVIAVPTRALLGDPANRFVYLDAGNLFVPTPVVVGRNDGAWTEIRSGLIPGDAIVVTGNYELQFVVVPDPEEPAPVKSKGH